MTSVLLPGSWIVLLVTSPVDIRDWCGVYPRRCAGSARASVLVGADVDQRVGVPVVRGFEHDQVAPASVRPCQSQGQLVRLACRVEEVADRERRRQRRAQLLRVSVDEVMQVAW